jgi:rubredoxin-NAD+ reductase
VKPIIIIGAGMAGYTVAREFRKLDKTSALIVITGDSGGFYSKPMLSNAFAQRKQAAQLVNQSATQMAEQLNATILTGTRVDNIDSVAKTVATSAGTFDYEKLVLAVGAEAIRLTIAGDAAQDVLSVNHIDDYALFRDKISSPEGQPATHVTILGAGLIGCEFADDLAGGGHAVTLVDPNALPLAALAAPALSAGLKKALENRGIVLQLGTTAASIDREGAKLKVSLADGTSFHTDLVLSAVGLRPDLRLAQAAQLTSARGIVIDAYGQTSATDVFALGDCAEYTLPGDGGLQPMPYIAPLMSAARAIARTLNGEPTAIDLKPAPVIVKTPSFPLALLPPTMAMAKTGSWHAQEDGARIICRFYDAQGIMSGFGVAPQEAAVRAQLIAELGSTRDIELHPAG